ncbi:hypothetical protein THAOC_19851 [Thalassiosira oceanica]|uniref:Uncharacterized protein n=1 Tax=Thalassiosira oceanica TaxID=159749 RepID=K0S1E1_THAOC|nr:hypothetical protein THAOC_19851 [Thalassiosira oceanica]|eukprot:EJK59878.1 hypothetical protein THAOC_19851 [Thalassiosira oceanica]
MSSDNATSTPSSGTVRKRLRFNLEPSTAPGGPTDGNEQYQAPLKVATNSSKGFILASLPSEMQQKVQSESNKLLQSWSTYWNSQNTLNERNNDPEFIPPEAKIKLLLQPLERVSRDPGFISLSQQAGEVVKQCRKLLRGPVLAMHKMNAEALLLEIQEDFVKYTLMLTKLFIAHVVGKGYEVDQHLVVANLLANHENLILPWIKLQADDFKKIYREVSQLHEFPSSVQPPSSASGTGDSTNGQETSQSNETSGQNSNTGARRFQRMTVEEFLSKKASEGKLTLGELDHLNKGPTNLRLMFAENLGYDKNNPPPLQSSTEATDQMDIDGDSDGNRTTQDGLPGSSSTNNGTDGARQGVTNQGLVLSVLNHLSMTIKGALIDPIEQYRRQIELNAQAARVKKEIKKMNTVEQTDKVAERLESEPSADPTLLKILVKDGAEKAVKKILAEKESKSSKEKRGQGKSSLKSNATTSSSKKSSSKKSPGKRGNDSGAEDSNNATDTDKKGSAKRKSRNSSKKKKDATKTPRSMRIYGETLLDKRHSRPMNLAFHDLTTGKVIPKKFKAVLGLSYKFIITPGKTWSKVKPSLERFERDTHLKVFFADDPTEATAPPLRVKSIWRPPANAIPSEVDRRILAFSRGISSMFEERLGDSNLLPYQRRILFELRELRDYIIVKSDKGLGPCAIEFERYARAALVHLTNPDNYLMLTEAEATQMAKATVKSILGWKAKNRKYIDDDSAAYIEKKTVEHSKEPHGLFYIMLKIHKLGPSLDGPLKTRPVVSDCSSVIHPIGKLG